ncbi:MAG: phosphoenolpyruvate carboxykinase (ATP), partial [Chloroflexi bacterium]|nr:phosphoenolpyruvate carboxykinase (ATP) [Chloroflexota bacterium]
MATVGDELVIPGLTNAGRVFRDLPAARLAEQAVCRGEGRFASPGAVTVVTGKYTGRSPEDKFVVDDAQVHDIIAWGKVNKRFTEEQFSNLYARMLAYLQHKDLFVFNGFVGADKSHQLSVRIVNEFAWQNLFARQLFIRPTAEELESHVPSCTVIAAPGFKADPALDGTRSEAFVVLNFTKRIVLIGGTHYAGEIKKSVFTMMNYLMPNEGVLPMHCSANVGANGDTALFFGLSGTGKTTLSADPERSLIGDDEHGWSDTGVFNFEGG